MLYKIIILWFLGGYIPILKYIILLVYLTVGIKVRTSEKIVFFIRSNNLHMYVQRSLLRKYTFIRLAVSSRASH